MNLDNIKMNVIQTTQNGAVNESTIFTFSQTENVVSASYCGGKILKGYLVGTIENNELTFSYCQLQVDGMLDNGRSVCEMLIENDKIRLIEHFTWASRNSESGVNIFEEM